ncbi:MAG: hypothetical protein HZB85_01970 [Deltaproteobacteria bacterium]|nr:hypothetical protein [Deltaproteobacteria bacterium]
MADRWLAYEKLSGNIVMASGEAAQAAAGLAPVIFPHWRHGFYYDCKACHDGVFKMRRTAGTITHEAIARGEFCGRCHNGELSFASDKDCAKCHVAGLPGSERMTDTTNIGLDEIKETAKRLGSGWYQSRLEKGVLPLDRFGDIDWEALREDEVWKPIKKLDGEGADETRQTVIVFKPTVPGVKQVAFDHAHHTAQIRCESCHQEIFEKAAGGSPVSMDAIASGRFCGTCHGKTAFKLAGCSRCHSIEPDRIPAGALVRE